MTKEIRDIISAFKEAQRQGRQTALATVVHVEGSSYRMPGARMLVEDNGTITGAISGGCLEGDALRKALLAINQKQNKLVTYNTLDEDDVTMGVQLGCNGIVHILFEPIDPTNSDNPVALLERSLEQRRKVVIATLFSLEDYYGKQPGTCFFFDGATTHQTISNADLAAELKNDAALVLNSKSSLLKEYLTDKLTAFIELIEPPVSLIVVGAGNDALPMIDMATILGWQTTLVDGRSTHATKRRFPTVHQLIVGKPEEAIKQIEIDDRTVFVLMTHNYNYDLAMLELLLKNRCTYIGTLGPKKRLQRMIKELEERGMNISEEQRIMCYGPTGLDIGAGAAEEIALSVLAEIKAVLAKRNGSSLRDRKEAIHTDSLMVRKEKTEVNSS
jgi:xanthine dehydrogenase accessory factor